MMLSPNGSSGTAVMPHGSCTRLRLPRLDTVVEPQASRHQRKQRSGSFNHGCNHVPITGANHHNHGCQPPQSITQSRVQSRVPTTRITNHGCQPPAFRVLPGERAHGGAIHHGHGGAIHHGGTRHGGAIHAVPRVPGATAVPSTTAARGTAQSCVPTTRFSRFSKRAGGAVPIFGWRKSCSAGIACGAGVRDAAGAVRWMSSPRIWPPRVDSRAA